MKVRRRSVLLQAPKCASALLTLRQRSSLQPVASHTRELSEMKWQAVRSSACNAPHDSASMRMPASVTREQLRRFTCKCAGGTISTTAEISLLCASKTG